MLHPIRLLNALIVAFAAGSSLTACSGSSVSSSGATATSTAAAATAAVSTPTSSTATSITSSNSGYALSGVVTGYTTANLKLTGAAATSATTDSNGNYTFSELAAGNYTVTPSQTGYVFSPVSRAEKLSTASISDIVFSSTADTAATYGISGTVTGSVTAGVVITLNGSNVGSTVTDLSGNYSFSGLVSGTYTVTASLTGYAFTAPLIVSLGTTDSSADNFTATPAPSATLAFTAAKALPSAIVGAPYSSSVVTSISGGTAPYHYQSGSLDLGTPPLGMIVNPNGNLTGTANIPGLYDFAVCAVDSTGVTSACVPTSITVVAATASAPAPSPTPTPTPAATTTLEASPATIVAGGTTQLNWSSQNAASCAASGGWTGSQATSGVTTVSPTSTTTYTLACTGTGGIGKASVVVTVNPATPAPAAPTVSLTSSTATINAGDSTTLRWSSKNASTCVRSGGWTGTESTSGEQSVSPSNTTTYELACNSSSGTAQASTKIVVNTSAPDPTVTLTANPATVTAGDKATLTWSSNNATSCSASGGWNGTQSDSGTATVSPTATATYKLQCTGAGGTAQTSATVTVTTPQSAPTPSGTSWVYYNGTMDWPGDYSFSATVDYNDTSGNPLSGAHDTKVTLTGSFGGWLPYAQNWNFNSAPYTKLTFSLKPTVQNQSWNVYFVKVGDIPVGVSIDPTKYGPAPVVGQWATYTVPLADLGVLGTSIYKFCIHDQTGLSSNVWYVDNVGFVP